MIDISPNNQNQQTIKETISISGIGLHSGKQVQMKLVPAEIDHGVKFIRSDKKKDNIIDAIWSNVSETVLSTTISNDWVTYSFNFPNISPSEEIENFAFVFNPHTETEDTIYWDNFTLSEVLSINKKQKGIENKIILYPNPIQQSNQIAIDLESDGLINTIEIMSIDGKNIETILINSKKALINMSQYSKGIYLAKIVMDNNTSQTRRITK